MPRAPENYSNSPGISSGPRIRCINYASRSEGRELLILQRSRVAITRIPTLAPLPSCFFGAEKSCVVAVKLTRRSAFPREHPFFGPTLVYPTTVVTLRHSSHFDDSRSYCAGIILNFLLHDPLRGEMSVASTLLPL